MIGRAIAWFRGTFATRQTVAATFAFGGEHLCSQIFALNLIRQIEEGASEPALTNEPAASPCPELRSTQ